MKRITLVSLVLVLFFTGITSSVQSLAINGTPDSVQMGPGYANDIYYSFENGVVASVSRMNWDIGIHTTVWSATLITNGGGGVNLYTYPNADTTGWNSVDTVGMASWTILYDNEDIWEDGAFTRNSTGHPDYGWGKYNPISHDVVGDSVYILKTLDGTYKKIWIVKKNSANNKYYMRYANLDGTDDQTVELGINPYQNVNFVYYSFAANSLVEREPEAASWDILFTRYMAIQPNGTPYPVVGIYNNLEVRSIKFYPVAPDFTEYASMPFDSTKSPIGWEWKMFDMGTFTWTVEDSTAYFVHTRKDNIYKLVFTKFEGTNTGNIVFTKEPMAAGIFDGGDAGRTARVYPNPVRNLMSIDLGNPIHGAATVSIFDITGRKIYSSGHEPVGSVISLQLPESMRTKGLHMLTVETGEGIYTSKFLVY